MEPFNSKEPTKTHPFPSNEEQKAGQIQASKVTTESENDTKEVGPDSEPGLCSQEEAPLRLRSRSPSSSPVAVRDLTRKLSSDMVEVNGRERLKRHRIEVAGRVWIPDMWGQEELLKDWTDCTAFDASLVQRNIMSARAALVEERRIRTSSRLPAA